MKRALTGLMGAMLLSGTLLTTTVASRPAAAEVFKRHHYSRSEDWDQDGIPNNRDRDDDNDGIPDSRDPNPRSARVVKGRIHPAHPVHPVHPVHPIHPTRPVFSKRDADRDGIKNGKDHDIDGDGRRNSRDHDKDGDGRRNSRDRHDKNPRRH